MLKLSVLTSAFRETKSELAKLRGQIEAKRQRLEFLQDAPQSREDTADEIEQALRTCAAKFEKSLEYIVRSTASDWRNTNPRLYDEHIGWLLNGYEDGTGAGTQSPAQAVAQVQRFMLYIMGEEGIAKVRAAVMKRDWSAHGPQRAARIKEIEKLESELAALTAAEKEILDEARDAGVPL